jgi:transposase
LPDEIEALLEERNVASGVRANLEVVRTLNREIARLEREVSEQVKLAAQHEPLLSIAGIGRILALAIMLELEPSSALPGSATSAPMRAV